MSKPIVFVSLLAILLLQCQQQQIAAFKVVSVNVQKSYVPVTYVPVTTTTYAYVPPPTSAPVVIDKTALIQAYSSAIASKVNLLTSILTSALQIKANINRGLVQSYQNSVTSGPQNAVSYSKTVIVG